jgi:hypothetical protein
MNKFKLLLLAAPSVLTIVLPLIKIETAVAAEAAYQQPGGKFCVSAHQKLVCVRASELKSDRTIKPELLAKANATASDPDGFVNFSDEESDGAIKLFGCDCPACIRSLRQLRMLAPIG